MNQKQLEKQAKKDAKIALLIRSYTSGEWDYNEHPLDDMFSIFHISRKNGMKILNAYDSMYPNAIKVTCQVYKFVSNEYLCNIVFPTEG